MPKFIAVTEDTTVPVVPKVVFKAWADNDGDFTITANEHLVAVFTSKTGKLDLFCIDSPELEAAFDLDRNGYIKVVR